MGIREIASISENWVIRSKDGLYICNLSDTPYYGLTEDINNALICPNKKFAKQKISTYRVFTGDRRKHKFELCGVLYKISSNCEGVIVDQDSESEGLYIV